jgi:DNA-binding transcriptional LysR family regulator
VVVEEGFVDILAAGCGAGIRYEERLAQDMIAIPIGPRQQRTATAASPAYLKARGRPAHPCDLLNHACPRGRFASGATPAWEFQRGVEVMTLEPSGPLIVRVSGGVDLAVDAAVAGCGVIHLFEAWWRSFAGPFLYYPGRRHLPAPLRAFVDFVQARRDRA